MEDKKFNLMDRQSVIAKLARADDAYTNEGQSFLSDLEYDTIRKFAQLKWPNDPYFERVGSQVRTGKIDLPVPMPSLDQVQTGDLAEWLRAAGLDRKTLVITKKLDGVSVLLNYSKAGKFLCAYSRGDGLQGADITRHVQHLDFPKQIEPIDLDGHLIRGEIMCSQQDFDEIQTISKETGGREYANPRNMVAGLLNSSEIDDRIYKHLALFVYQVIGTRQNYNDMYDSLFDVGFLLPHRYTTRDPTEKELEVILTDIKTNQDDGFECDGLVIYVDSFEIAKVLDHRCEPGDNPKSAIKYKIAGTENRAVSEVVDVEWNVSGDGYFKPRIKIKPIKLLGTTVQYATGFNARYIIDNGVVPGAVVTVQRAGDVIPFILKVEGGNAKAAIRSLPKGGHWNNTQVDWIIDKTKDQSSVVLRRIAIRTLLDFFSTLKVDKLKEGNVATLYDGGFTKIVDIIHADEDVLVGLIGSNGSKIFKSLHERLMDIDPWVLYGAHPAFGRGVGTRKFKALFDALGSAAKNPTYQEIIAVEGFQDKTARKIVDGLSEFNDFLTDIYGKYKFKVIKSQKGGNDGKLVNQTVVMTGFRDSALSMKIESEGGKTGSAVSKSTTIVVAANPLDKSGKIKKAEQLGIPVVSRSDFVARISG